MLEITAIWMFPALFLLVFLGFPVAFSMIGLAFVFGIGFFGETLGAQMFSRLHDVSTNYVLTALPLFVFMGAALERSGIAEKLFYAIQLWIGQLRGGLALTSITMCAVFAACSGVVGAVETIVGMMAIPAMLKQKYKNDLISGTICAGGSLGTIIPPTVVVIVYASIVEQSIGDLFAGIIFPGLIMTVLFLGYILVRAYVWKDDAPIVLDKDHKSISLSEKIKVSMTAIIPAAALVTLVLGSILAGVASPTEAAGVGAMGAVGLVYCYGKMSIEVLKEILTKSIKINAMVMFSVAGGIMFSSIFLVNGGNELIELFIEEISPSKTQLIIIMLAIIFVLGFILDWVAIVLICMPIFAPIIKISGIDPVWFGIMVCIVIQTSYLTPPVAPSIFYLRAIAPPEITYEHMFKGVIPFIICQLIVLFIVAFYPQTALYLPMLFFGN